MTAGVHVHLMAGLCVAALVLMEATHADECVVRDYQCELLGQLSMYCHYSLPPKCSSYSATVEYYPSAFPQHVEMRQGTERWFEVEEVDLARSYTHIITLLDPSTNSTTSSTNFTFEPKDIIKPYRVQGLEGRVESVEKGCMLVRWIQADDGEQHRYRVQLTEQTHQHAQIYETDSCNWTVCHVCPASTWRVEVVSKYYARGTGHPTGLWSDPTVVNITMPDDIAAPPRLVPAVSSTGDGMVTIYWRCLSRAEAHSSLDHYLVEWSDGTGVVQEADRSCSYTLPRPHPGTFTVRVSAVNNVGTSPPAVITIFPKELEPTPAQFRVWKEGEELVFRWTQVDSSDSNFTLIWCTASKQQACRSEVKWLTVSCKQQSAVVPIQLSAQRLLFGLSLSRGEARSSISWSRCLYSTSTLVGVVEKFELAKVQPSRGVEVRWRSPDCYNAPFISHYLLSLCLVSSHTAQCAGKKKEIDIANTEREYRVEKLRAGVVYRLTIRAVSLNHTVGPPSAVLTVRVKQETSMPPDFPMKENSSDDLLPETDNTSLVIPLPLVIILVVIIGAVIILVIHQARGCRTRDKIQLPNTDPLQSTPMSELTM